MYNRYQGNSGRVVRVPDTPEAVSRPGAPSPPQQTRHQNPPPVKTGGGLMGMAQGLMQKLSLSDLDEEDLLLLLILYFLYRESGDRELLFILGGLLFL